MKHGPYDFASSFYPALFEDPSDDWASSDLFHDPFFQYSPQPAMSGMFNMFRRRKPQDTPPPQSSATSSPATLQSPPNQNTQPSPRAAHSLAAPHNHSSSSSSSSSVQQHQQQQHTTKSSSRLYPNIDEMTQQPSARGTSEESLSTSYDGKYSTPASTPSESNRGPTPLVPPGASLTTIANNFIAGQQGPQSQQRPSSNSTTPNGTIPKPDNSPNGQLAQIRSSLDSIVPKVKQFSGTRALFFLISGNPNP